MKLLPVFMTLVASWGGDIDDFAKKMEVKTTNMKNNYNTFHASIVKDFGHSKDVRSGQCDGHWTLCPNICHVQDHIENFWFPTMANKIMPTWERFVKAINARKDGIAKEFDEKLDYIDDGTMNMERNAKTLEEQEDKFIVLLSTHSNQLQQLNERLQELKKDYDDLSADLDKLNKQTTGYKDECERIAPCRAVPNCQLGVATAESCQAIADNQVEIIGKDKFCSLPEEGIYLIKPKGLEPRSVICKFTQSGTGYTVFQNRFDGSQSFDQKWKSYKSGFGEAVHMNTEKCNLGEYWLGNEYVSRIMGKQAQAMIVELERYNGNEYSVGFDAFKIGSEAQKYKLFSVGKMTDPDHAGNPFNGVDFKDEGYGSKDQSKTKHIGMAFSTSDNDNDKYQGNCGEQDSSGWWFNACSAVNLNGVYHKEKFTSSDTKTGEFDDGVLWASATGTKWESLKSTQMMVGNNLDGLSGDSGSDDNYDDGYSYDDTY